jgi:hypothetical protein
VYTLLTCTTLKKLFFILLLLTSAGNAWAIPFTILAKSGLNVRKAGHAKAEVVGKLPFGTVVEAQLTYESTVDHELRYLHPTEEIEGKKGFWMKITYGKIQGYIFSGFCLYGDQWVVPSTAINRDFRLLTNGGYKDAINYDPGMYWYAMVTRNGKMTLKKVEITLKLIHEIPKSGTFEPMDDDWGLPIQVQTNLKDSIFFLLGAKKPLEEKVVFSRFLDTRWNYTDVARFLYPDQTFTTQYNNTHYTFRAYERLVCSANKDTENSKLYQIELKTARYEEHLSKTKNLSTDLYLTESGEKHGQYKTPQLIWTGDVNSDGWLDFIYYAHTMSDGCGVCWSYQLFLSDATSPLGTVRYVANEISCS